jgi:transposase
MLSISPNLVEVVSSVQRRRRWTPEQKLEIIKQTNEPGRSVSLVAVGANETVVPASELQEAMKRIEQFEGGL